MTGATVFVLALALTAAFHAPSADRSKHQAAEAQAPIPRVLLAATKAYVVNGGVKPPAFGRLVKDLRDWKRFRLVDDAHDADVIITIKPPDHRSAGGSLYLSVVSASDNVQLWGDTTGPVWSESTGTSKLIKRLRERLEAAEKSK